MGPQLSVGSTKLEPNIYEGTMPTQEFETEIAVKIALLEPKEIAELRGLAELASMVAAQTPKGLATSWTEHLRRGLVHFIHAVLNVESASESPLGRRP
jgi:hypothetical protein